MLALCSTFMCQYYNQACFIQLLVLWTKVAMWRNYRENLWISRYFLCTLFFFGWSLVYFTTITRTITMGRKPFWSNFKYFKLFWYGLINSEFWTPLKYLKQSECLFKIIQKKKVCPQWVEINQHCPHLNFVQTKSCV